MPRSRIIRPDEFSEAKKAKLQPLARILYFGLKTQADREGRLVEDPLTFKIRILPLDDVDIEVLLSELAASSLIIRYTIEGEKVIQIIDFVEDQKSAIHKNEPPSKIPPVPTDRDKSGVIGINRDRSVHYGFGNNKNKNKRESKNKSKNKSKKREGESEGEITEQPNAINEIYNPNGLATLFVACFYAGYAQNEEDPIAEPSEKEIEIAQRYIQRLCELTNDKDSLSEMGREFGHFSYLKDQNKKGNFPPSFTLAQRTYGDEFYKTLRQKKKEEEERRQREAEEEHYERFFPEYREYVLQREQEIKKQCSEMYDQFEKERNENRERLQKKQFIPGYKDALANFDTDETRLNDFETFMEDQETEERVLSFWEWDKEQNPHTLKGVKINER